MKLAAVVMIERHIRIEIFRLVIVFCLCLIKKKICEEIPI